MLKNDAPVKVALVDDVMAQQGRLRRHGKALTQTKPGDEERVFVAVKLLIEKI